MRIHSTTELQLAARLWRKDASLWPAGSTPAADRLGWLEVIDEMQTRADELQNWAARKMHAGGYDRVVVLGMGGASLAAAAIAELFPPRDGHKRLTVLDTIHPDAIAAQMAARNCLYVAASKSGDTLETRALYDFFHSRAPRDIAVITDADSPLHRRAVADGIAAGDILLGRGDIGGRYSGLSCFGLAPAALAGVDVAAVLARAAAFADRCKNDSPQNNPALALGLLLARADANKLILECGTGLTALGRWVEQMLAESLGKDGNGLAPVVTAAGAWAAGRPTDKNTLRVELRRGDDTRAANANADLSLCIRDANEIGAEFFRWEFATAIAAAVIGVNPFDQPDVDATKKYTRAMLKKSAPKKSADKNSTAGRAPFAVAHSAAADCSLALSGGAAYRGEANNWRAVLRAFQAAFSAQIYLGLLAYLPENAAIAEALESLRRRLAEHYGVWSTLGFAPRYLHSTGQLHKGGPRRRCFLQLTAAPQTDVAIPGRAYAFGDLYHAQADADFYALADAGAVILRVALARATAAAVAAFIAAAFPPATNPDALRLGPSR